MPNVGRPSKGCKSCRDRKLKCDLKRPSCSQCIRSGQRCHGYRDPVSMLFKDESLVVAKKAEKRYEHLAKQRSQTSPEEIYQLSPESSTSRLSGTQGSSSPTTSQSSSQLAVHSQYPSPESMVMDIAPSIEDQAVGFFISNHVSQPTIVPRGQFEWITELLSQPDTDEILRGSVTAVGLAGLANSTKNQVLMARAHAAYGSALKKVNSALQIRDVALRDDTLVSVILLGMFEAFVFDNRSIEAWVKHVEGACALINLRGKEQFVSSVARRVFQQFYGVVLLVSLVSLESGRAIPKGMRELYDYLVPSSDYAVQGRQWTTRLVHFMTDAINLSKDKTADPITMVTEAMSLDRELEMIKALIPKVWRYETVDLDEPFKHVHGTSYHVYIDSWIAQMWNNLRSSRMNLYKVIRRQLLKGYTQYSPPLFSREEFITQTQAAEQVIRTTIAGICASVPQISGMIPFPHPSAPDVFSLNSARHKLHPRGTFLNACRPTGLHHLIWPLYSSGVCDLSSSELRQWAIDALYFIALKIGTRQAIVLADELRKIERVDGSGD